jgi:hemerythrin
MQTSNTWEDIEDVLKYTNIDFIDHDHKILVEYSLKLNQIIQKSEIEFTFEIIEDMRKLLNQLYEYAVYHFDREEAFMKKYRLPNHEEHHREHDKILTMLQESLNDFSIGRVKISYNLKTQIMEWLIQHINVTDINFFDIQNWSKNLVDASDWNEVRDIIKLTGIIEIDEQHKKLTKEAISLMLKVSQTKDLQIIQDEFFAFSENIKIHFDYETKFISDYSIQHAQEHLIQHDYFLDKLKEFPEEIANDDKSVDELKIWILTWWINHINITDKETFDYNNWAYQTLEKANKIEDVSRILRLTHINSIDADHLHLMKVTLDLNQMVQECYLEDGELDSPELRIRITEMFREIYSIAERHFAREERIMKRHQIIDSRSHTLEHREILTRITNMLNNYENNRLYISGNIKTMILDWWIHHTNNIDYRTFVTNLEPSLFEMITEEERVYEKL